MNYKYDLSITYNAECTIGNKSYFSCNAFNGLFCRDISTDEIHFVRIFDAELIDGKNLHLKAFTLESTIIFVPLFAKWLAIFNIYSEEIEYIRLHEWDRTQVVDAYEYNGKIYIFYASRKQGIVCYDIWTKKVEKVIYYTENLPQGAITNVGSVFYSSMWNDGREVYGAVWKSNYYFRFNLENQEMKWVQTTCPESKFSGVTKKDDNLYFSIIGSTDIIRYSISEESAKKYTSAIGQDNDVFNKYPIIINYEGVIYLLPQTGSKMLYADDVEGIVKEYANLPQEFAMACSDFRKHWKRGLICRWNEDRLTIYPYSCGVELYIYDKKNEIGSKVYSFDRDSIEAIMEKHYKSSISEQISIRKICNENEMISVEALIACLIK